MEDAESGILAVLISQDGKPFVIAKASPADPNRIYASQTSSWFGQIIQRSNDGGKTWETPGGEKMPETYDTPVGVSNKFSYDTSSATGKPLTTHQWYDGSQKPWEFKRVWHLEPSSTDPRPGICRSERHSPVPHHEWRQVMARTFSGLQYLSSVSPKWQPGAGGMCLHTVLVDPKNPKRIFIAISAAGAFRTDDGGETWKPINRGLKSESALPDPNAEVGRCVPQGYRFDSIKARRSVYAKTLGRDAKR
ncbi:MAG: hypothetical protein U5K79_23705 [Cyclobacteriaceae bacterium]|nr:hypothetical protein [Cyclobacteriaceae bacterium]